jgi:hypothetical protein
VTNLNIALEKYVEAEKRRDVATMIQLQSAIRFNVSSGQISRAQRAAVGANRQLFKYTPSLRMNCEKLDSEGDEVCCGNRITFSSPPCPHFQQIRQSVLQNFHAIQRYLLATKLKLVESPVVRFSQS